MSCRATAVPTNTATTTFVSVLDINPESGALTLRGESLKLPARPIHLCVSGDGRYVLIAYNNPSSLTVHAVAANGAVGEAIPQAPLDTGIYAHQIRTTASGRSVIMVTRGNDTAEGKPEEPGALKVCGFEGGRLIDRASIDRVVVMALAWAWRWLPSRASVSLYSCSRQSAFPARLRHRRYRTLAFGQGRRDDAM